jgi:hypothetical protein
MSTLITDQIAISAFCNQFSRLHSEQCVQRLVHRPVRLMQDEKETKPDTAGKPSSARKGTPSPTPNPSMSEPSPTGCGILAMPLDVFAAKASLKGYEPVEIAAEQLVLGVAGYVGHPMRVSQPRGRSK